jgi:hypothetical protein
MHPEAVSLSGLHSDYVCVVGKRSYLVEADAEFVVVVIEKAQLDAIGVLGINGEVGACPVIGCPKGIRLPRPDSRLQLPAATW